METKLQVVTRVSKERPNERLTSLAHILDKDFLKQCYEELNRNRAPGIDGITWKEYGNDLERNLEELVSRMKAKKYRPQPVKRAYIPKDDGSKRGLGIPSVEDKIVQMGIKKILEAIYEHEFSDRSFGFRPGKSAHDALEAIWHTIMGHRVNWVADIDIEKFFDTIDHKKMIELLEIRISDTTLLRLIGSLLKSGIMENGVITESERGTPQGGVLSPILANIYLHYTLDEWFRKTVKSKSKGFAELTRYADDFIACFENETDALSFRTDLETRLLEYGLKTSEKKSKIVEFGRRAWMRGRRDDKKPGTLDFLGFTYYCGESRMGKFKVERKTSRTRFCKKVKAICEWLKRNRNATKMREWWPVLQMKLEGHYQYYGISGNYNAVRRFYNIVVRLAMKWVNRRSQKRSFNGYEFNCYMKRHPLPLPRIRYKYDIWGCFSEEPYEGNPHVRFCEGGRPKPQTGATA